MINTGSFSDVQRIRLEGNDQLSHSGGKMTFDFTDSAGLDGVSFTSPAAATTITFTLSIDGHKAAPAKVDLGKIPHSHPATVPFTIKRA